MGLTLNDALQRVRGIALGQEVWCIVRFDKVDETMEVFWSTPHTTGSIARPMVRVDQEPENEMLLDAKNNVRTEKVDRDIYGVKIGVSDQVPLGVMTTTKKIKAKPGMWGIAEPNVMLLPAKHAEEYLFEQFPGILASVKRRLGERPKLVEIYVRYSPCLAVSNALPHAPTGCSNKLIALANHYPKIEHWDVFYDAPYTGEGDAAMLKSVSQIKDHPRMWSECL